MTIVEVGGLRVLRVDADGPPIRDAAGAMDLIGEALGADAAVVAVPVERLDPAFFQLRSGLAGEVAQKAVNYRRRLAIVGDISAQLEASAPLRDWVRECNRGREVWFVDTWEDLVTRLETPAAS